MPYSLFVLFVFLKKKSTKWIAYLDFVTLSYIQTSDEGVQINILYEKNTGCHFVVFHLMHLLYHQLDIFIYNSCSLEVKNRSFKHTSLLKRSLRGSNQILMKTLMLSNLV